jgi:hypothetical protein
MKDNTLEKRNRIILAVKTRLLREMLRHAIDRSPHLHIVGEAKNRMDLWSLVRRNEVEWVIMSLQPGSKLPKAAGRLLAAQPAVSILGITSDGSRVHMGWREPREETIAEASDDGPIDLSWVEPHEVVLEDLTLEELIGVLRGKAPGKYGAHDVH